ncbi:helix-turn-helix transcriptional regulator [Micromonospora sp. CPCC 206061]|uniref:helix-turn-helix transcriptional regulator n=1 Tax=Micromonospora sp. CPCC 206061 TaxID=3122410 RepID=UPI002FF07822
MTTTAVEPLWDIHDVSRYLRISPDTLYKWSQRRVGPPARRVGRHLRYDPAEVRAWFSEQEAGRARR